MNKSGADPKADILSAAKLCYLRDGIARTGMGDVAMAAGVARSTLYRYFPSRNDVLIATIKWEMEAANDRISRKLERYSKPEDFLVEGLLLALKDIPANPLLKAVFASDEDAEARRIIWNSNLIVQFGEQLMERVVQPALAAGILQTQVDPEAMVEWVYRVLLSFLTLPSNAVKSEEQMRATLRALLVPVLLK